MAVRHLQLHAIGGKGVHIHVAVALGYKATRHAGPLRGGVGLQGAFSDALALLPPEGFEFLSDFCERALKLAPGAHVGALGQELQAHGQSVDDNLPVFDCLRNHGNGASMPSSPESGPSPPRAEPAGELPMDRDDTAAEERMLSRESERLDEFGDAPGTSSGEELDIVDFLEAADRERLLAALRRSSRR